MTKRGFRASAALLAMALALLLMPFIAASSHAATGERWVRLATREVSTGAARATFDLTAAKGAFSAIRVSVLQGSLVLTGIEIAYDGGRIYREPRALVMQAASRTAAIDKREMPEFLARATVSFRATDGTPARALILIEGLQTADGATAMRQEREKASGITGESERAAAPPLPPIVIGRPAPLPAPAMRPALSAPRSMAEVEKGVDGIRGGGGGSGGGSSATGSAPAAANLWDVVPVFYGTDRNRESRDERAMYGGERARRLELGRALVTVPKVHEVPKVERPWTLRLPFTQIVLYRAAEDPRQHFTLKEVRSLTREDFLAGVKGRLGDAATYREHALVFVHGFNNSFDGALFRTAQIAYDLKFDGATFLYSWPSRGAIGLNDYPYDRESAGQAEPYLRQFLEIVTRETGATSVSIIAHSMGNQLLLPALRELERSAPKGVAISQVIMAAPDVDRDTFANIAREIAGPRLGMTLLAASNDLALAVSRRFWGGVPRAGDIGPDGPVIVGGVDTIDVTPISTDVFSLNHSGYADKTAVLEDIQKILLTGVRPPDRRLPILERVKLGSGEYYRYPRRD